MRLVSRGDDAVRIDARTALVDFVAESACDGYRRFVPGVAALDACPAPIAPA